MALSITVTRSWAFPAGRPVTLAALRLGALPGVSISGSVTTGDIAAGAITPALTSPGAYFFGTTAGGTTAYTLALNPSLTALANGVKVIFKMNATNTGASTLAVDGLTAKKLMRAGVDLRPGDLMINGVYEAAYNTSSDGGSGAWEIISRLASPDFRHENIGGVSNAYTWTSSESPAIQSLTAIRGQLLLCRIGTTNTGACTLAVDGLPAKAIVTPDQTALSGGELRAGALVTLSYSSIFDKFVLLSESGNQRPCIAADCRNLEIRSTSTTQAALSADEVILKSTAGTGVARLFSAVSLTLDVNSGVALNGLETGASRTTSTWYYIWLISDGTNVRGVLETAGTGDGAAPAGPDLSGGAFTGYNFQGLVGMLRLNSTGSGEIVAFHQRDRRAWIHETNVLNTAANGASTTYIVLAAPTAFRSVVPPNAVSCCGVLGTNENVVAKQSVAACANDGTADTTNFIGAVHIVGTATTAYESFCACGPFEVPVRGGAAARNIQWKADATTNDTRININGYTF